MANEETIRKYKVLDVRERGEYGYVSLVCKDIENNERSRFVLNVDDICYKYAVLLVPGDMVTIRSSPGYYGKHILTIEVDVPVE